MTLRNIEIMTLQDIGNLYEGKNRVIEFESIQSKLSGVSLNIAHLISHIETNFYPERVIKINLYGDSKGGVFSLVDYIISRPAPPPEADIVQLVIKKPSFEIIFKDISIIDFSNDRGLEEYTLVLSFSKFEITHHE